MEKSLFLTYEKHYEYLQTADNIIIAKILFDQGNPFPSQRNFLGSSSLEKRESFFFEGLSLLFRSPICYETDMDDYNADDDITFSVAFKAAKEWDCIGQMVKDHSLLAQRYQHDTDLMIEDVEEMYCDYFEIKVKTSLTPFGVCITLEGYNALFHPFVSKYVGFLDRIETKVRAWKEILKGEMINGENSHYTFFGETGYRRKVV